MAAAFTSLRSYGMAPPPLQAPAVPPYQAPSFGYTPPTPGRFTGTAPTGAFTGSAPTATPYGAFTGTAPTAAPMAAFNPSSVTTDPGFAFRLSESQKGAERSAAARGTLLTGGFQKALAAQNQGLASQEYGNAYQRALASYGANRDTHQQNFGQEMAGYQGALAAYGANRDTHAQNFGQGMQSYQGALAGYGANRDTHAQNFGQALSGFNANLSATGLEGSQGLSAATAGYDRNAAAGRQSWMDARDDSFRQTDVQNANAQTAYQSQLEDYARMTEATRRQNAAQAAVLPAPARKPLPGSSGPWYPGGNPVGRR